MAKTRTEIQAKYDAENRKTYSLKLNVKYDADIIEKLDSIESKNGYIRDLIRQDIARTCSVPGSSVPKTDYVSCFVPGKQDLPSISDKVKCLIKVAIDTGIEKELLEELKKL